MKWGKKALVFLVIFSFLFFHLSAFAGLNNVKGYEQNLSITLSSPDFQIEHIGNFDEIKMEGFLSTGAPGQPMLPRKVYRILVPYAAENIKLEIVGYEKEDIDGIYNIELGLPITDGYTIISETSKEENFIENLGVSYDEGKVKFFLVKFSPFKYDKELKKLSCYKNVELKLSYTVGNFLLSTKKPASFLYKKDLDKYINKNEAASLNYTISDSPTATVHHFIIIIPPSLQGLNRLNKFKEFKVAQGYDVTIVTTDSIYSNPNYSNPNPSGLNDNVEKIRNYLKSKWNDWGYEKYYALLIGDPYNKLSRTQQSTGSTTPMRYFYPNPDNHEDGFDSRGMYRTEKDGRVPTDYYYANLSGDWDNDGDDGKGDGFYGEYGEDFNLPDIASHLPDIYVGRIPFDDPYTVFPILEKSMAFEQRKTDKEKILFAGAIFYYKCEKIEIEEEMVTLQYKDDGAVVMEKMLSDFLNSSGCSKTTLYEKSGIDPSIFLCDYPLDTESFTNQIKSNTFGIVAWAAHGWMNSAARRIWKIDIFNNGVPEAYEIFSNRFIISPKTTQTFSSDSNAIYFSNSCLTSFPDMEDSSLTMSLLKTKAATIVGSTRISFGRNGWDEPGDGGSNTIEYQYIKYLTYGKTCGEALHDTLDYLSVYFSLGYKGWQNVFGFTLYGDPTLRLETQGTINVNATLNGSPWSGDVDFTISNPDQIILHSVPISFSRPDGTYTITYNSGGSPGATLDSITPLSTQTLSGGNTITFTLNFTTPVSYTGDIIVNATLDGNPWNGPVTYSITGPQNINGSSVPLTFNDKPVGNYMLVYNSGGPDTGVLSGISPSSRLELSQGQTTTFTLKFVTNLSLELTSPRGGETLNGGDQLNITWTSENLTRGSIGLFYSIDDFNSLEFITELPLTATSYTWTTLPNVQSDKCYIVVANFDGTELIAFDYNKWAPFTINQVEGCGIWMQNSFGSSNADIISLAVNPQNPDIIYAGTQSEVFKSVDAGETWVMKVHTNYCTYSFTIDPQNPDIIYAGTYGGGIYKSTDSGEFWYAKNAGLTDLYIYSLAINPQNSNIIYAGTQSGVFKSVDAGETWVMKVHPNYSIYSLAIDPQNPDIIYAGAYGGGIYKSTDSGEFWYTKNTGLTNLYVYSLAINPQNSNIIYAGAQNGIYKSADAGETWAQKIPSNYSIYSLIINPHNPNIIYAGTYGGVLELKDLGENWFGKNLGPTSIAFYSIAVNVQDSVTIYAGTYGKGLVLKYTECPPYSLSVNTIGSGTVVLSQPGGVYPPNTILMLTATPDSGYHFTGWSGNIPAGHEMDNPLTITMDSDKEVTATFEVNPPYTYNLTVDVVGSGYVSENPSNTEYDSYTTVTLRAYPSSGYHFTGWSGNVPSGHEMDNPLTITMDSDKIIYATFEINPVGTYALTIFTYGSGTVTVTPDPFNGIPGLYSNGTVVTLTAEPNPGWHFVSFSGHSTNSYTITMNSRHSIDGRFEINPSGTYALTAIKTDSGSISLSPSSPVSITGVYYGGTTVTLRAYPSSGYHFTGWSGNVPSGHEMDNPLTITMDSDKIIYATFEINPVGTYALTIFTYGSGTVTVTPDPFNGIPGLYSNGTVVTLTAEPDPGWHFVSFSGHSTNSYTITMNSRHSIDGRFEINPSGTYALTAIKTDSGSISLSPSSPVSITGVYYGGTTVTLRAYPSSGYHFTGWSGNVPSGHEMDNPLTITMDSDKIIYATFEINPVGTYALTIFTYGSGTVTVTPDPFNGIPGLYSNGTVVTLTAEPNPGWHFVKWYTGSNYYSNSYTITMNSRHSIDGRFEINPSGTYALTAIKTDSGSISLSPSSPVSITGVYYGGTTVTLRAYPSSGYHFTGWSGNVPSGHEMDNPLTITMDSDKIIYATFEINPVGTYALTIFTYGSGTVTVTPDPFNGIPGLYSNGTVVTLTAEPNPGWHFVKWYTGSNYYSNSYTITMNSRHSIDGRFEINPSGTYALTAIKTDSGSISLSPSSPVSITGVYYGGTAVTLRAYPSSGYHFTGWSGNVPAGHEMDNPLTITMDSDKIIYATFEINPVGTYALTIFTYGSGTVTVTPDPFNGIPGLYSNGTVVTLTAEPNPGWHFVKWYTGSNYYSNSYTITMNSRHSIDGRFEINPSGTYALTAIKSGKGSISLSPSSPVAITGVYYGGTTVTLGASPYSGYHFTGWSGNVPSGHEMDNPLLTTMDSDKTITATFEENPPTPTLTQPNGGETLTAAGTYSVTWTIAGDTSLIHHISVDYSTDNGVTWHPAFAVLSGFSSSMSHTWTVPNVSSANCKLKIAIKRTDGTWSVDYSDNVFTIQPTVQPPTPTLTQPNGSETLTAAGTYSVTWTIAGDTSLIQYIAVDYSTDNGVTWHYGFGVFSGFSSSMSHNWTVPNVSSANCILKIAIKRTDGTWSVDYSDNVFTIQPTVQPPTPTLTQPNGGETLTAAGTYSVTWTIAGDTSLIHHISVDYSTDNGVTWHPAFAVLSGFSSSMSHTWTVPNVSSANCKLKIAIKRTDGTWSVDYSDNVFTIQPTVQPPTPTLTQPNGGETLTAAGTYSVTWTIAGDTSLIHHISVDYSTDNGVTWHPAFAVLSGFSSSMSHTWTVPNVSSANCKLKIAIKRTDGTWSVDYSDNVFTIQ